MDGLTTLPIRMYHYRLGVGQHSGCGINEIQMCAFFVVKAMQLKPDEGTPELASGRVRVRLETDGSVHDVAEYEIEKVSLPNAEVIL